MTDSTEQTAPAHPGTPRWVRISGIVVLILLTLVVVKVAVGGGNHGPGRHLGGDDSPPAALPEGRTPPAGGHAPPEGGHAP